MLKSIGFARTGPAPILEEQQIGRWRNTVPDRNLDEISRIKGEKQKRKNQFNARGPGHMVHNVSQIVRSTLAGWDRKRSAPPVKQPGKLGAFLYFEQ